MSKKKHKWTGWDWSEISEYLGVGEYDSCKYRAKKTRIELDKLMNEAALGQFNKPYKGVEKVNEIRRFVKKLSESKRHFDCDFFKELSRMEGDFQFLQYVSVLLEYLWD
tara:strand:- start:66 stop:392 length:327 start_codon:yes stop_codon:yes gene_type:complete